MWARTQLGVGDEPFLVRDARDFSLLNGLVLRSPTNLNDNHVAHIPVTLFPTQFPYDLYKICSGYQPSISRLMLRVANDSQYIDESLSEIVKVDDFTRRLLDINHTLEREGKSQTIMSCIIRSDYMLDKYLDDKSQESLRLRQVEVNAIASGMSQHSMKVQKMHDFIMNKYGIKLPVGTFRPCNNSYHLVYHGLMDAFKAYDRPDSYILLVAEDRSLNFSDHVQIELKIQEERPDIRVLRRSFSSLHESLKLGPNRELFLDGSKEIGLVYFRNGYDPSNYNFEGSWETRLLMERSKAIKCPSINFHLSGAKKFQQILNSPSQLEKYLYPEEITGLSGLFCKFWSIERGTPGGEEGFKKGLEDCERLVLKPQREGGGHNIYGKDIKPFLERIANSEDRSQYILMDYIDSPTEMNWLLSPADEEVRGKNMLDQSEQLVSELGIFGHILADGQHIMTNDFAGYLIRSKRYGVNEGGVASGYAGISSLILVGEEDNDDDVSQYTDKSSLSS